MTNMAVFLLELPPFVLLKKISYPLCNSNTLRNILMELGRRGRDDVSRTRTTLPSLFLEFSPFVMYLTVTSCPLCNSNTLRNIVIVFGRKVE